MFKSLAFFRNQKLSNAQKNPKPKTEKKESPCVLEHQQAKRQSIRPIHCQATSPKQERRLHKPLMRHHHTTEQRIVCHQAFSHNGRNGIPTATTATTIHHSRPIRKGQHQSPRVCPTLHPTCAGEMSSIGTKPVGHRFVTIQRNSNPAVEPQSARRPCLLPTKRSAATRHTRQAVSSNHANNSPFTTRTKERSAKAKLVDSSSIRCNRCNRNNLLRLLHPHPGSASSPSSPSRSCCRRTRTPHAGVLHGRWTARVDRCIAT